MAIAYSCLLPEENVINKLLWKGPSAAFLVETMEEK